MSVFSCLSLQSQSQHALRNCVCLLLALYVCLSLVCLCNHNHSTPSATMSVCCCLTCLSISLVCLSASACSHNHSTPSATVSVSCLPYMSVHLLSVFAVTLTVRPLELVSVCYCPYRCCSDSVFRSVCAVSLLPSCVVYLSSPPASVPPHLPYTYPSFGCPPSPTPRQNSNNKPSQTKAIL